MNTIGQEWLTYLGKESATEEVKVMCLCALYSALHNAETMDSVFHDCLDTRSKDVQFLLNTFQQVQSPGLWLECVGISAGDEELDNFLWDKGYREKAYSNGYTLLKTGESFPSTLTVYCGQDIRQLRNALAGGENLLDYSVYQVFFDKARCADSSCLVSLSSDCILTSVWVGRAEDIFR